MVSKVDEWLEGEQAELRGGGDSGDRKASLVSGGVCRTIHMKAAKTGKQAGTGQNQHMPFPIVFHYYPRIPVLPS
jgi:hypothetical protein